VAFNDYYCPTCDPEAVRAEELEVMLADPRPSCRDCGSELDLAPRRAPVGRFPHARKIIWSERQVEAEHGRDWRETPTSRKNPTREGGPRKALYFLPPT